jgi:signal transduction histidine kinase
MAVLYLPTVVLLDHFPTPSAYSLCENDCPTNALALTSSAPAWIGDVVVPLREVLYSAAFLATAVLLALRLKRSSRPLNRALVPVTVAAALCAVTTSIYLAARRAGFDDGALEVLGGVRNLMLPVAAIGFLAGLILWRLHEARALERLALSSESRESPLRLQSLLGEALDDPSLEILYRYDGGWRHADRTTADDPSDVARSGTRCVVELPTAAIVCDPALENHRALVEAAASWVTVATERARLNRMLSDSLRDIEDSRHRLATAAAAERRRIERDLHDGAQQRLVTLRVQLGLMEEGLEQDPIAGAHRLRELGESVEEVIDEVRSLARGIYPPLLADAGVVEALRAVAARDALTISVDCDEPRRYPLEVESAVYFCCLEALQNTAKHSGAAEASIRIECDPEELRFAVLDGGSGIDPGQDGPGAGLMNMRDRLAAVGGKLEIESSPRGTCVRGHVPAHARG